MLIIAGDNCNTGNVIIIYSPVSGLGEQRETSRLGTPWRIVIEGLLYFLINAFTRTPIVTGVIAKNGGGWLKRIRRYDRYTRDSFCRIIIQIKRAACFRNYRNYSKWPVRFARLSIDPVRQYSAKYPPSPVPRKLSRRDFSRTLIVSIFLSIFLSIFVAIIPGKIEQLSRSPAIKSFEK